VDKHAHQASTTIIHEFEIPRPSARVDVALINGRISGYEIKGSADTLARLADQERSFSSVFERMSLVVASRHVRKAVASVPDWWEIIETDGAAFRTRRGGRANPDLNLQNLLHVLTKKELLKLQAALTGRSAPPNTRKCTVIGTVIGENKGRATKALIRAALKTRPARLPF
jgi:hypothetical protein